MDSKTTIDNENIDKDFETTVDKKLSARELACADMWIRTHSYQLSGEAARYGMKIVDVNGVPIETSSSNTWWAAKQCLARPHVAAYISEIEDAISEQLNIGKEAILKDWNDIRDSDISQFMTWKNDKQGVFVMGELVDEIDTLKFVYKTPDQLTKEQLKCIKSISKDKAGNIKYEFYPRPEAITNIGKIKGLYIEKQEITGKDGGAIEIEDSRVTLLNKINAKLNAKSKANGNNGEEQLDINAT